MPLYANQHGVDLPKVVFLHGFGGSHAVWTGIQAAIEREATSLAYDLPGHAASVAHGDSLSPRAAAAALLADLKRRDLERVHLVGHSMGGAIATLMALSEPTRIASLTLLAPGGFGPQINIRLLKRYAAASDAKEFRNCLEAMYGWNSPVTEAAVEGGLAVRAGEARVASLIQIVERMTRDGRQGEIPRESLGTLVMPVSVLWGELDNVLPVGQARGLPPGFALHLLADTGHMLPLEAPDAVVRVISRNIR